ncbi:MAG TPA: tryptophan synthase alpha chain, partial [Polyangia bacterium]
PAGQTCGGGGTPNQCGAPSCTPTTCAAAGAQCGIIGNGCGGTVDCGACAPGTVCGGGGANKCGSPII